MDTRSAYLTPLLRTAINPQTSTPGVMIDGTSSSYIKRSRDDGRGVSDGQILRERERERVGWFPPSLLWLM